MKQLAWMAVAVLVCLRPAEVLAQEVTASKSAKWSLSGILQFQWLHDFDIPATARQTNDGFRVRRSRFKASGQVTPQVDAVFNIEVRDNNPRLKDAFGRVRLGERLAIRFGQFKVPVWREEVQRSSGDLLLVERSGAARFLEDQLLSARQVGIEVALQAGRAEILFNLSNGAGEGLRETAGTSKDGLGVNNGKLVSGRVNLPLRQGFEVGVSLMFNRLGGDGADLDRDGLPNENRWRSGIAPDFLLHLDTGPGANLDIEGGLFFTSTQDAFVDSQGRLSSLKAFGLDLTGRHRRQIQSLPHLGGVDALELAAGLTFVDPNTELGNDSQWSLRAGPGVRFGKTTRLQVNGELVVPQAKNRDATFRVRAQTTFNF